MASVEWRKRMAETYKGTAYCVKCKEKHDFEGKSASVTQVAVQLKVFAQSAAQRSALSLKKPSN